MFFDHLFIKSIHFLAAAFFGLLAFLAAFGLLAFLVDLVAVDDDPLAAVVAEDDPEAVADLVVFLAFGFDVPAAFFFGDAAFFFGLLALPAAFGLADPFDFGLAAPAVLAFLVPDAFFFGVVVAELAAVVETAAVVPVLVVAAVLLLVVAAFFVTFLVGEAERFRLVAPPADFALLDDVFFVLVPVDFLFPPGVFDRLRGLAEPDFFVDVFF